MGGATVPTNDRSIIGAIAAHERWAREDQQGRRDGTQAARDAYLSHFEKLVDPDGLLQPDERRRRALNKRKAHMLRLSKMSKEARDAAKALRLQQEIDAELANLKCVHQWPGDLTDDAQCDLCHLPYKVFSVPGGAA
jgi:hypothetical protein